MFEELSPVGQFVVDLSREFVQTCNLSDRKSPYRFQVEAVEFSGSINASNMRGRTHLIKVFEKGVDRKSVV